MKTMIINTLGLLMVAFVMFMIFKKIKSLLPSVLGSALSREPVPVTATGDDLETDSDNEEELNNMSNIIELDEEDIDVDDINSDDEIVLNKSSSDDEEMENTEEKTVDEEPVEEPVVEEPVEEPVVEEPVEEPVKPAKKGRIPKGLKNRKGKTIKL